MTSLLEAGVDPRYWYPAVRSEDLAPGALVEAEFSGRSFVVYRDRRGEVHCMDNACLHRKVALHEGTVEDCRVVCPYHGWQYEPDGRLAVAPNAKTLPDARLRSYPAAESDGMVWFVPEPSGTDRPLVAGVELDDGPWLAFKLDRVFENHYGIGLINGMDYFHFHLHRKYQPWSDIELLDLDGDDERVCGAYLVKTRRRGPERVLRQLLGSGRGDDVCEYTLKVHYHYPHHTAELGDGMRVTVYFRPIQHNRVAVYITLYVRAQWWNRRVRSIFEPTFRKLVLARIQHQDAWIGELEQRAWERYPDDRRLEINRVAAAAERLLHRKWATWKAERVTAIPVAEGKRAEA